MNYYAPQADQETRMVTVHFESHACAESLCACVLSRCASGVASKSAVLGYFIVAQILTSSGLTPLLSLIPTYLQENVEKHELGLHLAWQQGAISNELCIFLLLRLWHCLCEVWAVCS